MAGQRVAQIVRILDEGGRPRPGVRLAVRSAQGPTPEMAYITGEDGRVQIGLPPGAAELEAFGDDGSRALFKVEASDRPGHEHELQMTGAAR